MPSFLCLPFPFKGAHAAKLHNEPSSVVSRLQQEQGANAERTGSHKLNRLASWMHDKITFNNAPTTQNLIPEEVQENNSGSGRGIGESLQVPHQRVGVDESLGLHDNHPDGNENLPGYAPRSEYQSPGVVVREVELSSENDNEDDDDGLNSAYSRNEPLYSLPNSTFLSHNTRLETITEIPGQE